MKPASLDRRAPDEGLKLSDSQRKVIKDKYLRDAPDAAAWLKGVAHNVALAEILCHPQAESWGTFEGVSRRVENGLVLFHDGLADGKARNDNFVQLMANLEKIASAVPAARDLVGRWEAAYYELMSSWDFLPNSPTLMNAGRELQQLSACYVLPVPDSMEGIMRSLAAQSLIQKSGGGTGFSFSRLRPNGDSVNLTRGVASGALSFMQLFDKLTDVVKQGGMRRGANMGILHYTHPEIKDFIAMKSGSAVLENFNVSVAVDETFMRAVRENAEYDLINPRTGKPCGKARAKDVFDMMCEHAWKSGDPGFVVIDRINASASNPTPALGQIESTNPCGEQPLLPWEPCNLGSISLSRFVQEDGEAAFDFERLRGVVHSCIRFLDDVIDVNNYPLAEIERMAKGNRRIGLGVMGWAETLVKMGIPYDSPAALDFAEKVMGFINRESLDYSEALAVERGTFPNWKDSIYDPKSSHFRGQSRAPRHAARTTLAPTGTIAIAAGLQGGGIEPFFAIAYTRYNAKALEAMKKGQKPEDKDVMFEVNPLFAAVARRNGFFGLSEKELWAKISANHNCVRGIAEIPEAVQNLFPTAHDVSIEAHVRMQAAFQAHTDNGVSKTINLPNSATVDDVRRAYWLAYDLGCKGITVYRDGSKGQQVLTSSETAQPAAKSKRRDPAAAFGVKSEYFQIKTGHGPLHIHINYDELGPYQVFTNIPPLGTEIAGLTSLMGILLSKYLAEGGEPLRILKHLNAVKGDKPVGFGAGRVNSIPHAISLALRSHLKKTGWIETPEAEGKASSPWLETAKAEHCPKCYSSNVSHESGCSGPTCHDCGFSECS